MSEVVEQGHAPHITVYSKDRCSQCDRTMFMLDRAGAQYDVVKIDEDTPESRAAYAAIEALGYKQVPVVITNRTGSAADDIHWSGLDPDRVNEHALGKQPA